MKRLLPAIVIVSLLGAFLVVDRSAPVAAAPGAPGTVGARAGFAEGSYLMGRTDAALAAELDGIAATGARYLRVDFDWWAVQPTGPQTFEWGMIDRVVNAARSRGLEILALVAYTPPWARPPGTSDKVPPTNPADYANFARAAVQRYSPLGVKSWEIWNEANIDKFWAPAPDPAAYTRLLQVAYAAIKAVDPGATVLTAGLSPAPDSTDGKLLSPVTFLRGVYAAGGAGFFDAVGHHPSNYPFMPLRPEPTNYNWNAFGGVTPVLRQTMVDNGDGAKKIWATEMGAPTPFTDPVHQIAMTPEYLADYLTEAYSAWTSWSFTGPLLWYSYRDGADNPSDIEANFGLVKVDGTPKEPALSAYRNALAATDPNGGDPPPTTTSTTTTTPTTTVPPTTTTPTTTPTTTTPPTTDTAAPAISNLRSQTTRFVAAIRWSTNEPASSEVEYWKTGTTTVHTQVKADLVESHHVKITGLARGTTYTYRARSTDAAGNTTVNGIQTFTTRT